MEFLTFGEIVEFLKETNIRYGDLQNMIAYKQLYQSWHYAMKVVSYDSFSRFLAYNSLYRDAFYNYNSGDDYYMKAKKDQIIEYMENTDPVYKEEYSISQLEQIFGITKKTIKSVIWKSSHPLRHIFRKNFSVAEILIYLKNNPDSLEKLKDRHDQFLSIGNIFAVHTTHILMLYSYYEGYGYII